MKTTRYLPLLALSIHMACHSQAPLLSSGAEIGEFRSNIGIARQVSLPPLSTTTWLVIGNSTALSDLQPSDVHLSSQRLNEMKSSSDAAIDDLKQAIENLQLDVEILDRTQVLASGLIIRAEQSLLSKLRKLKQVKQILPLYDYSLMIADSAKYIGASQVIEDQHLSGRGLKVAVIDTAIDFTHKALGGSGNIKDYQSAIAEPSTSPSWPQGNIIGGYDFVDMDPNPIDTTGTKGFGHATHVAHSMLGVAPETKLYVYRVCNRGCSGRAIAMAVERAMDPNDDGDISDRVDIINMSLGSDYGISRPGGVSLLLNQAAKIGVISSIAAGNDGANPFIVAGPSTTENAISVAAMTHPTIKKPIVTAQFNSKKVGAKAAQFNLNHEFLFDDQKTPLLYPAINKEACQDFSKGTDFSHSAVLIDRGSCAFVNKVDAAQKAGASLVIIANNKPNQDPFTIGGEKDPKRTVPAVMISKKSGDDIKKQLEQGQVTYRIQSQLLSMEGSAASFSSRGPALSGILKPEITAPGVSIMTAQPGSGDKLSPASGTSFSAPITAGAIALLSEKFPYRTPLELKATLMNSANLNVTAEPTSINPNAAPAPISAMGAGRIDLARATALNTTAWDSQTQQAALAFGYVPATEPVPLKRSVVVKNFSPEAVTYSLSVKQRMPNDEQSGAIKFDFPKTITIAGGQSKTFPFQITITPTHLPPWDLVRKTLKSGELRSAAALTTSEYDGALIFSQDGEKENLHLVYHILPRANPKFELSSELTNDGAITHIANTGSVTGTVRILPLQLTSPVSPDSSVDLRSVSFNVYKDETCQEGVNLTVTLTTEQPIALPNIAGFFVDFDLDRDKSYDYSVQTISLNEFGDQYPTSYFAAFSHPYNVARGSLTTLLYTSGNYSFTALVCPEDIGLTKDTMLKQKIAVRARIESSPFNLEATDNPFDVTEQSLYVTANYLSPRVTDAKDHSLSQLEPAEVAQLKGIREPFILISDEGSKPLLIGENEEDLPPTIKDQRFFVDENTKNNTLIGVIEASDPNPILSPVTEIVVESSNSNAVSVNRNGEIRVAHAEMLDFEQGMVDINLQVVAIDTHGQISAPAEVIVSVKNLPDTQKATANDNEGSNSSSGGSSNPIVLLLITVLGWIKRNRKNHRTNE